MKGGFVFKKWQILGNPSTGASLIDSLLEGRGLKTKKEKEEFLNPTSAYELSLKELKIKESEVKKAIKRIEKAKKNKEKVIVYGDYDCDGICATAILWETLYSLKLDVLPFIPDRFNEGYGLNGESIKKLKGQYENLGLIITVDNGIVASKAVEIANKLGIDVVITDHHQPGKVKPKAFAVIHTTQIGGSAVSWIFSREVLKRFKAKVSDLTLELAGIGTIADQLPLTYPNRSFAKYGLADLNKTKRPGFISLFGEARIKKGEIGMYEVNFIIAPRINAMGRIANAIDSLRLLCTKSKEKAEEIAKNVGITNLERQKLVDQVVKHARESLTKLDTTKIIVLSDESYHEGVIGLAAGKLVEEFYRPSIVISKKGKIAKASARSISGFNIIEHLRKLDYMWIEGGGHPMAAGFSLETVKIEEFRQKLEELVDPILTEDLLTKKLRIDLETDFKSLTWDLVKTLTLFEPTGLGNPTPVFLTKNVEILDIRPVGSAKSHLKLKLSNNGKIFDAIAFGFGDYYSRLLGKEKVDVVYNLEENVWNGSRSLQLKVKDLSLA